MRHEQAAILILSYIIGFTTAYIAFGINSPTSGEEKTVAFVDNSSFIGSMKAVSESASAASPSAAGVEFTSLGMFTTLGGEEAVISGKLVDGVEPGPGFHYHIPFTEVSPNGEYIHYCEQETADLATCKNYVYVVAENKIYPLKVDGQILNSDISINDFSWTDASEVVYGDYRSVSTQTPWRLQ